MAANPLSLLALAVLLAGCAAPSPLAQPVPGDEGALVAKLVVLLQPCEDDADVGRELRMLVWGKDAAGHDHAFAAVIDVAFERQDTLGWRLAGTTQLRVLPAGFRTAGDTTSFTTIFDDGTLPGQGQYRARLSAHMAATGDSVAGEDAFDYPGASVGRCAA